MSLIKSIAQIIDVLHVIKSWWNMDVNYHFFGRLICITNWSLAEVIRSKKSRLVVENRYGILENMSSDLVWSWGCRVVSLLGKVKAKVLEYLRTYSISLALWLLVSIRKGSFNLEGRLAMHILGVCFPLFLVFRRIFFSRLQVIWSKMKVVKFIFTGLFLMLIVIKAISTGLIKSIFSKEAR